jgi:hypothetical protein
VTSTEATRLLTLKHPRGGIVTLDIALPEGRVLTLMRVSHSGTIRTAPAKMQNVVGAIERLRKTYPASAGWREGD